MILFITGFPWNYNHFKTLISEKAHYRIKGLDNINLFETKDDEGIHFSSILIEYFIVEKKKIE